jgi:hypothetical protein
VSGFQQDCSRAGGEQKAGGCKSHGEREIYMYIDKIILEGAEKDARYLNTSSSFAQYSRGFMADDKFGQTQLSAL